MTTSLEPDQVERLRKKLYEKAKREPDFRFYSLYDKVCWIETLEQAYRQAKANAGTAGVNGVRFEDIEAYGWSGGWPSSDRNWWKRLTDRTRCGG